MAVKREPPTAADVFVTALSPILIMGLVGSLVFFLAEVFYAGQYDSRLRYTLFFFVIGAVLVGRVAVAVDRMRAWMYGGFLALVSLIALHVWVAYPADSPMTPFKEVINVFLVGVVWWSSNRLCWDCTFIDENRPGSGKGLLAAAGWEHRPGIRPDVVEDVQEDERRYPVGMQGWYKRFDQWQKSKSKKPHTPGLTVVYFSLAALPIFGLGQSLIPADAGDRRAYAFRLAAVYVGSGLALLLTTSFLGLRRYLRQRKLRMPATMTATWMGLGAVLIVVFLVVGALIPRPYSETPAWNPTKAFTNERNASDYAVNSDGAGKGSGRTGEQTTKGDGEATGKGGEPGGKGKDGEAKKGSGEKDGKNGSDGGQKSGEKSGEKGEQPKGEQGKEAMQGGKQADGAQKQANKGGSNAADRLQNSSIGNAVSKVAGVLKWILFAVLAIVVLFFVFRNGLKFLSNFMPWARNLLAAIDAWLKGLFGSREPKEKKERAEVLAEVVDTRVPFTSFSNPFADGTADGRSPEDLVGYSFHALEAWAGDRDRSRREDETAIEFSNRLGEQFAWLRQDANKLSNLVARMVYAGGNLPTNTKDTLDHFWDRLTSGAVEEGIDEEAQIVE